MLLRRTILSTFFSATQTAASALYAELKFKAYYNVGFHLEAITTFICHLLRALYNLNALLLRVLITPFCILNPFSWPSFPGHAVNLVDDFVGLAISLTTIALHPVIFTLRTLSSMIFGYEEGTDYDLGVEEEEEDLNKAMAIW